MSKIRLDKFICDNTMLTRSQVKDLIKKKSIFVNDLIITKSDYKIDLDIDVIKTPDGIVRNKKNTYIILNKPEGYICSTSEHDGKNVLELVPPELKVKGLFPAGRLDKDSMGMVLLTDDGELAHRILSPKKHIPKIYVVKLANRFNSKYIDLFAEGVILENNEVCLPAKVKQANFAENWAFIELCEGKFHQVKRMFSSVENSVEKLFRISMGNLEIPIELGKGECMEVMHKDVEKLTAPSDFERICSNFSVYFSSYLINK